MVFQKEGSQGFPAVLGGLLPLVLEGSLEVEMEAAPSKNGPNQKPPNAERFHANWVGGYPFVGGGMS